MIDKRIYEELYNRIMTTDEKVHVLVLKHPCKSGDIITPIEIRMRDILEGKQLSNYARICFHPNHMPFPEPATPTLYFFKPKQLQPMYVLHGKYVLNNLKEAIKHTDQLMEGKRIEDVIYTEEERELIKNTEEIFENEEDLQKLPSKLSMVRSLGKEMWDTAKRAGKKLPVLVPTEVVGQRWDLCSSCEFLNEQNRCTECGCFMKAKVNLASASCPIDKWGVFNEI